MPAIRSVPSRLRLIPLKENHDSPLFRLQFRNASDVRCLFAFRPFDISESKGDDRVGLFRRGTDSESRAGRGTRYPRTDRGTRGASPGLEARVF